MYDDNALLSAEHDELGDGPEMPASLADWPVDWLANDPTLQIPDCPCCVEPEPAPDPVDLFSRACTEPVGWAIPMVPFGTPDPTPALPSPSPTVIALQAMLDQISSVPPTELPGPQALVDTEALLQLASRLRVHLLERIADVDTRQLHTHTGVRSTRSWVNTTHPDLDPGDLPLARTLRTLTHLSSRLQQRALSLKAGRKVAAALVKVGPQLDRADGLIDGQPAEALIAAVVSNVVDLIARSHGGLADTHPLLTRLITTTERIVASGDSQHHQLEQAFTLLAEHLPVRHLPDALDELVCALLPHTLDDRTDEGESQARLQLDRRPDGTGWDLRGRLDLECGELAFLLLGAAARRDPTNPDDTTAAEAVRALGLNPYHPSPGTGGSTPGSTDPIGLFVLPPDETVAREMLRTPRSAGRRLHDAFKQLLQRYLDADLPGTVDKQPVRISITLSSSLLEGRPGAAPATTSSGSRLPPTAPPTLVVQRHHHHVPAVPRLEGPRRPTHRPDPDRHRTHRPRPDRRPPLRRPRLLPRPHRRPPDHPRTPPRQALLTDRHHQPRRHHLGLPNPAPRPPPRPHRPPPQRPHPQRTRLDRRQRGLSTATRPEGAPTVEGRVS